MKLKLTHWLLVELFLAVFVQNLQAGVSVTITPSVVSNTYSGNLTLLVTGLPSGGQTIVVQKFLDANTNGVIDAGDLMFQQFTITDGNGGMVIGGVTNNNVPGDTDAVAQQITAKFNFQADWAQTFAGSYLIKISSPSNTFTPLTNSFTVTNFNYAQKFTGTVLSNSTPVPNAVVILFPTGVQYNNPLGGTVANNLGVYSLPAPAGSYTLVAARSNFVSSTMAGPILTLTNGTTFTTNLALIAATETVTGRFVDTNNTGLGLPGLLFAIETKNHTTVGIGFSDTNGNFTVGVTSNLWGISISSAGLAQHGYVAYQNKTTVVVSNNVTGLTIGLPKATAFFYGTVKDTSGNAIPGEVAIYANDYNGGVYESDGFADTNGNYAAIAIGGLGAGDPWYVDVDNGSSFPNYVFSQPTIDQNGGTNIAVGQVVLANIIALPAANRITGNVKFNGTNLTGVQVEAYATIGTNNFYASADTDANGNYSLPAGNGSWTVNLYDCGCADNDSLNNVTGGNYQDPASQPATISGNNATVNFTVPYCGGVQITTTSPLPSGQQGTYYYAPLSATDCNGVYNWSLNDPADFPSSINLEFDSSGEIYGVPNGYGTFNFTVSVNDGSGHSASQLVTLVIAQGATPLGINTYSLSNAIQNAFCSYTLSAAGGQIPYTWSLVTGSASLPAGLSLSSGGVISGTPIGSGNDSFLVQVTDNASTTVYQPLSLTVTASSLPQKINLSLLPPAGASLQFSFKAASGVTYTVQTSTDLKNWSKYETFTVSNGIPTSGTTYLETIPNGLHAGPTFYRVKVGP